MNTTKCRLFALGIFSLAVVSAGSASAQDASRPGGKGDYLMTVGKRTVWASQAPVGGTPLPAIVLTLTPAGVNTSGKGDFLITIGKRTVWASTIAPVAVAVAPAAPPDDRVTGRFAIIGKATVWTPGCSMCVNTADANGNGALRMCKGGAMACSPETKMAAARAPLCCQQ